MPYKTYDTAYIKPEEPPPPNDPRGYRGPQPDIDAVAKPALLITGSREWEINQLQHMTDYVSRVVQRADQQDMRIIVGDNPQGVDHAVVQACHVQGVDCLVYGVDRSPRNPLVLDSQHCRYVQTMREEVQEIHPGGLYHEPEHKRVLKRLGYPERDERMVENADRVLAIWNGRSPGTKHAFDYAASQGKDADLAVMERGRMRIVERTYDPDLEPAPPVRHVEQPEPVPDVELANDPAYDAFLKEVAAMTNLPEPSDYHGTSLEEICEWCGVDPAQLERDLAESLAFHAFDLTEFGLELDADFDQPSLDSLPHYDFESDTALWIGVVRDDVDDKRARTCVLAVQDVQTNHPQAYITPCYEGDFAQALECGEQLVDSLHRNNDLDHFLGVVEGMARAHHLPYVGETIDKDTAHDLADHVDQQLAWDIDL
ncbi:MAG: hypothetical protein L0154_26475 [Chloroflexi bacterium]|nr:hypothetical protein [Chloroflexota bacterium]